MKERPGKGKAPRTETNGDPAPMHPEAETPVTDPMTPAAAAYAAEHGDEHGEWRGVPGESAEAAREAELSTAAAGIETPPDAGAEPWPPAPEAAAPGLERPERPRPSFAWALAVLILVLIALGTSPFWAPLVAAGLPWGPNGAQGDSVAAQQLQDVEGRLHALEQRPALANPAPGNGAGPAVEQLNQRVAQLDQKVGQLEQRPAGSAQGAADLSPLQGELRKQAAALGDVGSKVSALESRVGQLPAVDPHAIQALQGDMQKLAVNVGDLANRVGKLETQEAAQAGAARAEQALMLGLGQLREAVLSGRPYTAELAAVRSLARDRQDVLQGLQPLEASAGSGVPTLPVLTQRFETAANDIVRAEQAPPSEGWGDQILARLRSLVTVRRVGRNAGDDPVQNAVATAEGALQKADLDGAVQALDGLQGAPAQAAKPWLDQAHARLAAEAALDKVDTTIVARLAQGSGGSAGTSSGARSAQ
jgi:hypothetical protein